MILLFTCGCQKSQPTPVVNQTADQGRFQWLDISGDSQVWNGVQAAFRQELKPDDPRNAPPHYLADQYKYVYKIGVFRTAALVIIGYRETINSSGYDYFDAYSYDLHDGSRRTIVTEPPKPLSVYPQSDVLWLFEVVKLAQFDSSPTPDVVFTYSGCTECEADHFLASFEYDPVSRAWTARQWDKVNSLLLAYDPSPGDDVLSSGYLFKIKHRNGDGFDDVAVRRRVITQVAKRSRKTEDSITIYKAENGTLVGHPVTDPKEREEINGELCSGSNQSLCKPHKSRSARLNSL